ncbi:MAG: hypothetical protein H6574_08500 [Lewinellaceae bacterium]|nr:hypothetical protein [Saprospiraceae bacterium]MCB9331106.1 hypothetical protein [Lewinellaceae bacterium]
MRWYGIILLVFTVNGLIAQSARNPVIDSLNVELAMLEGENSAIDYLSKKARISFGLGKAHHDNGQYELAKQHLHKARAFAVQAGDSLLLAGILNQLASTHMRRGVTDSAILYYKSGLLVACSIQSHEHIKTASAKLYAIHKEQNNHAEALRYLELYQSAKDTLVNGEHIRMVTNMAKDYSERVERYENTAKIQQHRFVSIFALAGLSIAILVILFLIVFYRLKQAREREKRKIQEQLMVQERMASLGMLTAGIAHEIKNPLNFINNFAGINKRLIAEIQAEIDKDPTSWSPRTLPFVQGRLHDLEQNSTDIETSGKEINRIVLTMMDHSRGTSDSLRKMDLNELVEDNVNLVYQSYRATHPDLQIHIDRQFDPVLPKAEIYPHNFARVIINILSNAFYALNQKHGEFPDFKPCLTVVTRNLPDAIALSIRDNGPGVPAEVMGKIFTPFFTTKPVGLGNTGLGLSISYNIIVHEHKGKLEVDSEPGMYTEFTIVLPRTVVDG